MIRASLRLASLSLLALAACSDPETSPVNLLLTDAPGDVLEAVVTIDEVYLQGGTEGRVVLTDEPVTVNLLTLADDFMTMVEGVEVPNGDYSQLRFVISGAYILVEGETGNLIYATSADYEGLPEGAEVAGLLQTPSWDASGFKVSFTTGLSISEETTFLVDFDVAESFGHNTGSDQWVLAPILKGSVVEQQVQP